MLIIPEQQESIQPASVTGICPGSLPCRPGVRVFRWPGLVLGVIRYLETCTQSRTGRSSAPSLVYPSDRNGAVRMVETTFRHFQSTFSPLSVHVQSTWGSTYMSTYVATWTPWRSTSKGVAKGMVERAGGHLCLRSGATRGSAGHGLAGGRDNLQQLVEQRTPSVVDDGGVQRG